MKTKRRKLKEGERVAFFDDGKCVAGTFKFYNQGKPEISFAALFGFPVYIQLERHEVFAADETDLLREHAEGLADTILASALNVAGELNKS